MTNREKATSATIVYSRTDAGHKSSYARLFSMLFEADILHRFENRRRSVIKQLVNSEHVLFLTLDDDIPTFVAVSLLRFLKGRSTSALFLRPQFCFHRGLSARLKRLIFSTLRTTGIAKVFVILPFNTAPHYAKVAVGWVYDPELWDLDVILGDGTLPSTDLSNRLLTKADGRPIVLYIGDFLDRKGSTLLTELLETDPKLSHTAFFVAAGRIGKGEDALAKRFELAGGYVVGRRISDMELFSLYKVGAAAWSCYSPVYDQASGAFGRSVQASLPSVIRAGSKLEKLAKDIGHDVISIPFEVSEKTAAQLCACLVDLKTNAKHPHIDFAANLSRRNDFMNKIRSRM